MPVANGFAADSCDHSGTVPPCLDIVPYRVGTFRLTAKVPIWYKDGMDDTHPLTAFRERHDPPLSQQELAGLVNVTRETVNRWESGARKIEEAKLPIVCEKTGIDWRELRPDLAKLTERAEQAAQREAAE